MLSTHQQAVFPIGAPGMEARQETVQAAPAKRAPLQSSQKANKAAPTKSRSRSSTRRTADEQQVDRHEDTTLAIKAKQRKQKKQRIGYEADELEASSTPASVPPSTQLNTAPKQQLHRRSASSAAGVSASPEGDAPSSSATRKNRGSGNGDPLDGASRSCGGDGGGGDEDEDGDGEDETLEPLGDGQVARQESGKEFKAQLVWRNIFLFILLHSSFPVGAYMLWHGQVSYMTLAWSLFGIYISGIGVTGGAHRLWSHKAYKARAPVQVLLMLLQTMAGQNSVYTWCRDHRVHHKFSETDADPHNIKRGFFFAHMGWLCCRKHPAVSEKGATIDMSDLEANPIVMFQHKHFWWLTVLFNVLLPSMVPVWFWSERFWSSFTFSFLLRYLITLHGTWLVNSAAHYYGSRPYDKRIEARESPMVILTGLGEGFHNYHHTFPYDYSTSEFGHYFNLTTAFIDACAALGLAYDRRSMSRATIEQRQKRTGDQQQQQQAASDGAKVAPSDQAAEGGHLVARQEVRALTTRASGQQQQQQQQRLVSNLIHELPYFSGLFSMKYTL